MSNFEFMKKQNILDNYPAFDKMYQYLISAEKNYFLNHQLCGMNVRWALEQFCCLVSDLTGVQYDTKPTYMGQFLSPENRFKLLVAVRGEVNYRAICEINSISREYAHSITSPNEDTYEEMLPKIFVLVVWLYKVLLGIELNFTYSSFSYDNISQDESDLFFMKKDDVIYTSREQVERIKRGFPQCDTNLLYSIRKNNGKFELLDEEDNVVEAYVNEDFITVNEDLRIENESLSAVQEQLRHTIEIQNREKQVLETKVNDLSCEIEIAEKKINELEMNFQTQTEAYDVLVKLKNSLLVEKNNLEETLKKSQKEYAYLNSVLKDEIKSYKEDRQHLETLLSNAEAQSAYYKALVEKYSNQMQSNTNHALANVERFENGYHIYKRTKNEEEFKKVLLGIRFVIDGVREEVRHEKFQREQEKVDTDRKIKNVENMVKKNNTIWAMIISILCLLCISLVFLVGYLIENKDTGAEPPVQTVVTSTEDSGITPLDSATENNTATDNKVEDSVRDTFMIEDNEETIHTEVETSNKDTIDSGQEEEQSIQNPDDRLEVLKSEKEKKGFLPRTIAEIEDVNTSFLSEYTNFVEDMDGFYELARWGDESELYQILSKKYVPYYEDTRDFFERKIYTISNSNEIKYVYMRHSAYSNNSMYGVAIAPEALSARLAYSSTKDDLINIFGAEHCKEQTYNMGYVIPEMEDVYGVAIRVKLEDCEVYIFMDETGSKIVDHAYILGEE